MRAAAVRRVPQWKVEEVETLAKLFKEYPVFAVADLTSFPTRQLQMLRKKLSGEVVFRVSKNRLVALAMRKSGIDPSSIESTLVGQNLLLFTKMNAFELYQKLEHHKAKTYYKPGEVVDKEVVVPEGDTGIPPGPMLSVFGKLKIPTRVQGNTIFIAKDTVVAKPGDTISSELAGLLQKLNLPLKDVMLKLKVVYDGGALIPGDRLKINFDEYKDMLLRAHLSALGLGVEIVWPEAGIVERAIARAYREAKSLAVESAFIAPEIVEEVLRVAHSRAHALCLELKKLGVDLGA